MIDASVLLTPYYRKLDGEAQTTTSTEALGSAGIGVCRGAGALCPSHCLGLDLAREQLLEMRSGSALVVPGDPAGLR